MRVVSVWLSWSATGWHWTLYILAAAAVTAVTGAVLYYHEPAGQVAAYDRELDRQFTPTYLPGPAGARVTTASRSSGAVMPAAGTDESLYPLEMARAAVGRVGEFHLQQPRYPQLGPQLRPDWLEHQLDRGRARHARQMLMQGRWRAQMLAEIAAAA
jgi:hypothetical protein